MGFKAGERIEFLDDGLVVRCLDLGSKSGCLGCCFLSYVSSGFSGVARARARGKKMRDIPSAASLAVGNSVVMPDLDPNPPILHTFLPAVPVPRLVPDRDAAALVGMLALIPGRVGAGWWRVLGAGDGVGTAGLAHGDECVDDGGGLGDADGFEIGIVCSLVESCLDVEGMGTGEAWRPADGDEHEWFMTGLPFCCFCGPGVGAGVVVFDRNFWFTLREVNSFFFGGAGGLLSLGVGGFSWACGGCCSMCCGCWSTSLPASPASPAVSCAGGVPFSSSGMVQRGCTSMSSPAIHIPHTRRRA